MRNTTMQDALAAILTGGASAQLESQSDDAVLSAVGATRRKLTQQGKKARSLTVVSHRERIKKPDLVSPVAKPEKINPFSIAAKREILVPKAPILETVASSLDVVTVPPIPKDSKAVFAEEKKQDTAPARVLPHFEPNARAWESSLAFEEQRPLVASESKLPLKIETPAEKPAIDAMPIDAAPEEENTEAAEPKEEPPIVLPSNLEWLKKPTPFSSNLTAIVDQLRDARQRVIFTLEQCETRQKEYRKQLDAAEYGIEEQRENLHLLEETIAACALVAEQSANLKAGLLVAPQIHHRHAENKVEKAPGSRRWSLVDPAVCHQKDVVEFFEANPNTNWTAAEITKAMPAAKQAHAKDRMNQILYALMSVGKLRRMGSGIYRMDKEQGTGNEKQGTGIREQGSESGE